MGALTLVENIGTSVDAHLAGVSSLAISGNGSHLYAISSSSNALFVFTRNHETGALTVTEKIRPNLTGLDILKGINKITLSGLNKYVIVSSQNNNLLSVFLRNHSAGTLTYKQTLTQGIDGITNLTGASFLASSPNEDGVYQLSSSSGVLSQYDQKLLENIPSLLTSGQNIDVKKGGFSLDGRHYYDFDDDGILAYTIDQTTGALSLITEQVRSTTCPANGESGENGLTPAYNDCFRTGNYKFVFSRDGKNVYLVKKFIQDTNSSGTIYYTRNKQTGVLTFLGTITNDTKSPSTQNIYRPYAGACSWDGLHFYTHSVNTERYQTLYDRNLDTGILVFKSSSYDSNWQDHVTDVALSRDGKNYYTTAYTGDRLSSGERDPTTGLITWFHFLGGSANFNQVFRLILSPDGDFVSAQKSNNSSTLLERRKSDSLGGRLSIVSGGTSSNERTLFTADSKFLYTIEGTNWSIYQIDQTAKSISLLTTKNQGTGDVTGTLGVPRMAPWARFIYTGDMIFSR